MQRPLSPNKQIYLCQAENDLANCDVLIINFLTILYLNNIAALQRFFEIERPGNEQVAFVRFLKNDIASVVQDYDIHFLLIAVEQIEKYLIARFSKNWLVVVFSSISDANFSTI